MERRTDAAFAELVRRHVDLVYSAAKRMVCDSHLAEDVTQNVFSVLAQNAGTLRDCQVLAGWLHRTTQNVAANLVRSEVRRHSREQKAAAMNELLSTETGLWEDLIPHLDAALGELSEPDRDALLLRYFERKSAREMALTLGTSEEAAQKRVSRAAEHLRELLQHRGVTTASAGALVAMLSTHAVQAAPIGLAISISAGAGLIGSSAISLSSTTVVKTLTMTALHKTLIAAALAVAVATAGYKMHQTTLRAQERQSSIQAEASNAAMLLSLSNKVQALEARNSVLVASLAQANIEKSRLTTEREQARHSAALYKELVNQGNSKDNNSTNEYPTQRHLAVGMGRFARMVANLSKDESSLSLEEQAANNMAKANAFAELSKLVQALNQLKANSSGADSKEDSSDSMALLLYGALDLDQQQFGQIYDLVQKYKQQAKENGYNDENPSPESVTAGKAVWEAAKAEIQTLLTTEQSTHFDDIWKNFEFAPGGKFNFNPKLNSSY